MKNLIEIAKYLILVCAVLILVTIRWDFMMFQGEAIILLILFLLFLGAVFIKNPFALRYEENSRNSLLVNFRYAPDKFIISAGRIIGFYFIAISSIFFLGKGAAFITGSVISLVFAVVYGVICFYWIFFKRSELNKRAYREIFGSASLVYFVAIVLYFILKIQLTHRLFN